MTSAAQRVSDSFQFTLPCRERPLIVVWSPDFSQFQFTLPCRERPTSLRCCGSRRSFNSRSRVGSDGRRCARRAPRHGFNSRSRVGSDDKGQAGGRLGQVSIHAPV